MYFEKINNSVLRLSQLTQCLGLYVEIDTSNESSQTISLPEIITAGAEQAMHEMNFNELELEVQELPDVKGFPNQIRQLFYHLIKNSIQFRDPNRKLSISVTGLIAQYNDFRAHENRYSYVDFAKIEFKDNAMGFSNNFASQVFRLFSQLHKDSPGIGFGLALCKKIVDNHFGTITCNSQPGKGTTFTILLPL
jgi:sigma-B regulation protein RsbU (phosphoserine phosphatase)